MSDHHDHSSTPPPETQDAGSQALAEALRSSFTIVKFALAALVLVIFGAGFFTVGPQEKAVILRFGKPLGDDQKMLLSSGKLYWSFPYPIDEVVRIPITENQQVNTTIGWFATTPEMELAGTEPPAGPSLNPMIDGYVITADRNIVHARATVLYHIEDPRAAIFNFTSGTNHAFNLAGVSNAVQNAANRALILAAAHFKVDDILTRDRAGFQESVKGLLTQLVEREHLGVAIGDGDVQVQSVPPRQLKDVFAQVTTARQNYDKLLNDARSEESRILNDASARATSITNAAESARTRFVTGIKSDAKAFTELLPKYELNPNLFAQLELAKSMSIILTNVAEKKFLPTHVDGKPVELRLMLNNEPPQQKTGANP